MKREASAGKGKGARGMNGDRAKVDRNMDEERQQREEHLNLLQTITLEVAAASDLCAALEIVLRRVCEETSWALGQAWIPNQERTLLECAPIWFCDNTGGEALKQFRATSEATQFKRGIGLPGRVWESKRPCWIDDVTEDKNFPRSAAAVAAGFRTGIGIPILSGERLIAVIEFFMRESRRESQRLVNVIAAVAAQLDLAIERKGAMNELSRTNEIMRSILSNMGDGVIVADREGKFLLFNPAAERMFGKGGTRTRAEEWAHRYGLYQPDMVTPFPPNELPLERAIRGEEVNGLEIFVRHEKAPNGLWVRTTGRPLRDSDGQSAGGIIVCHDITQIKEEEIFRGGQSRLLEMIAADKPLHEVLTSLVLLMEAQAEGLRCSILLLSRDGKHMNHGAAPHLPETYVKEVDGVPIGPRNGSCGTAMYTRKPVVVTDVMTDPLWADYRELAKICGLSACWSSPIMSPQGDVLGSFAMYREEKRGPLPEETRLTEIATHIAGIAIERKRQQARLRERDARISLVAESNDLAFWVLYPDEQNAWMSEKGRALYGFDQTQVLSCEMVLGRIHPDDRAAVKAAYEQCCASIGAFESEHRLLLPYGKTRWVMMRGRGLQDDHGKLQETIGVTVDVSAQKQAEIQTQIQRDEMAHRNRVALMGEMTASFAHELNQPLTAIANNASAARRFVERGNIKPELLQELLQDMVADSQRAGEVIRGIRSLVRKDTSVRKPLNLNVVIAETMRLVSSDVLSRESVVTTELDPQLPQVDGTLVQIQQVLLNLIINALDAIEDLPPAERRIVVSTRATKDGVAEIVVRDFGIGLPKDKADKIFEHFFSTKRQGMGMGLAIVRSIVESHGGTIMGENAPDRGARMIVRLPARTQAEAKAVA